jgi:hypothetical protein
MGFLTSWGLVRRIPKVRTIRAYFAGSSRNQKTKLVTLNGNCFAERVSRIHATRMREVDDGLRLGLSLSL